MVIKMQHPPCSFGTSALQGRCLMFIVPATSRGNGHGGDLRRQRGSRASAAGARGSGRAGRRCRTAAAAEGTVGARERQPHCSLHTRHVMPCCMTEEIVLTCSWILQHAGLSQGNADLS